MTEENYETVFFLVTSTLITLFTVAQGLLKTDLIIWGRLSFLSSNHEKTSANDWLSPVSMWKSPAEAAQ